MAYKVDTPSVAPLAKVDTLAVAPLGLNRRLSAENSYPFAASKQFYLFVSEVCKTVISHGSHDREEIKKELHHGRVPIYISDCGPDVTGFWLVDSPLDWI